MSEKPGAREVRLEIYIEASPETVFALLTDATEIKKWQAEIVDADPVRGACRLADAQSRRRRARSRRALPQKSGAIGAPRHCCEEKSF